MTYATDNGFYLIIHPPLLAHHEVLLSKIGFHVCEGEPDDTNNSNIKVKS